MAIPAEAFVGVPKKRKRKTKRTSTTVRNLFARR